MAASLPCQNERKKVICWGSWLHSGNGRMPKAAQMSWDLRFRWVLSWSWLDQSWRVCLSLQLYCFDSSACSAHTHSMTHTVIRSQWVWMVGSKVVLIARYTAAIIKYHPSEKPLLFFYYYFFQQFLPYSLFRVVFFTGFFQVRTENPPPFFCSDLSFSFFLFYHYIVLTNPSPVMHMYVHVCVCRCVCVCVCNKMSVSIGLCKHSWLLQDGIP